MDISEEPPFDPPYETASEPPSEPADLETVAPNWDTPEEPVATTPPAAPPHRRHRRSRLLASLLIAAIALGGAGGGYALTRSLQSGTDAVSTTSAGATTPTTSGSGTGTGNGSAATGSAAKTLTLAQIEAAVDPVLVDVTSTLGSSGTAEGTGMVISSTGEILTNNHVIAGATSITVQIGGTGTSYKATVVGYDVSDDVAVLQIPNVSGLATITTASASTVSANDAIVAIGNALGKGGTPASATGVVTALNQTITASDGTGSAQETLTNLIEIAAAVQPGDSGGATVNTSGQVIGMTTAAAAGNGYRPMSATAGATTTAYAIPIESALNIARQIEAGTESATVHIGEHGLLGVEVSAASGFSGSGSGSVQVSGVQSNSAAAVAGLVAGDSIVSINGHAISSVTDLNDAMAATHVGDKITVGWQDASGQSHSATVTLTTGAA
jgi:S1-C subfamily serine protease